MSVSKSHIAVNRDSFWICGRFISQAQTSRTWPLSVSASFIISLGSRVFCVLVKNNNKVIFMLWVDVSLCHGSLSDKRSLKYIPFQPALNVLGDQDTTTPATHFYFVIHSQLESISSSSASPRFSATRLAKPEILSDHLTTRN